MALSVIEVKLKKGINTGCQRNVYQSVLTIGLLFACLAASVIASELPGKVILATTNWCPYACPKSKAMQGIAYEYIEAVFNQNNIEVEIQFLPWTRAIKDVNSGRAHGLLTAVHDEAPSLMFTNTPTMSYQVCFFSSAESQWQYTDVTSLKNIRLGAIKDYGYGQKIDEYIRQNSDQRNIELISGGNELFRFFNMLKLERIDAFLDDKYVVSWEQKSKALKGLKLQQAGCLIESPFYMAFNPDLRWGNSLISLLDSQFKKKENQALLDEIVKKYTMKIE